MERHLLMGKEPELVREVERYQLDNIGLISTHSSGSGTSLLQTGWTLFYAGVVPGVFPVPRFSANVLEFQHLLDQVELPIRLGPMRQIALQRTRPLFGVQRSCEQ